MKVAFCVVFFVLLNAVLQAQPYKNPNLPVNARVNDLLSRMTTDEKFHQLFMIPAPANEATNFCKYGIFGLQLNIGSGNAGAADQMIRYNTTDDILSYIGEVNKIQKFLIDSSRLGIPAIMFDEALHGLVRGRAVAYPQSIALAATFDTTLMQQVSRFIAHDCQVRGIRMILSPVVNIASDVRWGRTEETYGEDPFLAAEMSYSYVSQFEKAGIITTPKHFITNVGDGGRDSYPINMNERLLREIYLPPFEACIIRGGARSVMTAYNSFDGTPCTANNYLLNDILKKQMGFKGFVISDAGATGGANVLHFTASDYADATAKSINGGLEVIFQTSYSHRSLFEPPFLDGAIDKQLIDSAVARVLRVKFELGLFENPYVERPKNNDQDKENEKITLAEKAALESLVLLKNTDQTLPLNSNIKSIAIIGEDAAEVRLGGYSGSGIVPVSILQGLKNRADNSTTINYTLGCKRDPVTFNVVPSNFLSNSSGKAGLDAEYFNNVSFSGNPVISRTDETVNFQWTLFGPDPSKMDYDFYSVGWNGFISYPADTVIDIGIDGNDGYRLFIDNTLLIDNRIIRGRNCILKPFHFEKNKKYLIHIEFSEPSGNAFFKLVWNAGIKNEDDEIVKAVALAQKSDVVIVAAGIEEGEFRDRAILSLPGRQEELIQKLAATGKPVIVVLVGGSAVTMNSWYNDADAILDMWYGGEQGGNAVAEALFGDYNPAGRLPVTFPVHEGQLPLVYNHKPTGRGDDYNNLTGKPLFPFGFGLSYTTFSYTDIRLDKPVIDSGESASVSFTVTNTGANSGDEVVQLYIHDLLASVARPVKELKGFTRIHLDKGESREVRFSITPEMLSIYNDKIQKVVEPGDFSIMIGASSADIRLKTTLRVK